MFYLSAVKVKRPSDDELKAMYPNGNIAALDPADENHEFGYLDTLKMTCTKKGATPETFERTRQVLFDPATDSYALIGESYDCGCK